MEFLPHLATKPRIPQEAMQPSHLFLLLQAYAASREFGLLCILLPLSHRRLCDLRCFSCGLLARLRKGCSSKSPQPCCNRGIFTAEPNLLASVSPSLFSTSPPTEMRLRAILLQTRSLYMWAWFAAFLQLHFWIQSIYSVEKAKIITAGNHSSELQISTETISQ